MGAWRIEEILSILVDALATPVVLGLVRVQSGWSVGFGCPVEVSALDFLNPLIVAVRHRA